MPAIRTCSIGAGQTGPVWPSRATGDRKASSASPSALVEESGVLLLPASIYGSALNPTPPDRFRIGLGRTGLDGGLAALEAHVRRNRG